MRGRKNSSQLASVRALRVRAASCKLKKGPAFFEKIQRPRVCALSKQEGTGSASSCLLKALKEQKEKYAERREAAIQQQNDIFAKYNKKEVYKSDTIDCVYIPMDLDDCCVQLDQLLSEEDKEFIKNLPDKKETIKLHMSLGMWIRNNWGLWGGSRLQKYLFDIFF